VSSKERYKDEGIVIPFSDSNAGRKSNSMETDWKTPTMSVKFQSHFGRSRIANSGDTAIGTSCSDSTEEFCNSNASSSFQPIKTQVTIPTAHVMPSTLGTSPSKLFSLKPTMPESSAANTGLTRNGDFNTERFSHAQLIDRLHPYGASEANGLDQSWFPISDQTRVEDTCKFDTPAMEPTLNQSVLMETLYADPRFRLQMCNPTSTAADAGKEFYKVLPEAKPTMGAGGICEQQSGTVAGDNRLMSLGLKPSNVYSNPLAPQPQVWRQELCMLPPHELNAWRHQLDNIQLQVEQMQLQKGAAYRYPSTYAFSVHSLDPAQWVNILNTNENLLKEKEILIDKQRQHISQLEQKVRESELQVHSALFSRAAPYGDVCILRLLFRGWENTFLRAQFTEKTESLGKEKIELERKLAASEADVKLTREMLKEAAQKHGEELKKQEERIKGRDKHINSLKKKCQKESEQNREKQQRIETLERYLADLPTLEDHQKQSVQLQESEQKSAALQETVVALERELGDVRAICREKEMQLETQKHKEMELLSTMRSLQDKVQQYGNSAGGEVPVQEMEKQKPGSDSLQKECDCLRKVNLLEEQVAQEEGTSQALKEEAERRENALQQLRTAVKELSVQNQDLIEKNLTLQEQLREQVEPSQALPAETTHLTQELHSELAGCLQDLQSVYSIVTQTAQGKDPNLSLLLGIHSKYAKDQKDVLLNPDVLAKKLMEVKQLHREIEDLRTALSDRYAQDMGDNCITQ
uniref:Centrosomal protein 85 n=1 Tax=Sphenodon punctatus TaxID=8508 RepID=A0A8D0L752_SPHPU